MSAIVYSAVNAPNTATKIGILAALGTTAAIGILKPNIFYSTAIVDSEKPGSPPKEVKRIKNFGTAPSETLLPIWMAAGVVGSFIFAATLLANGE